MKEGMKKYGILILTILVVIFLSGCIEENKSGNTTNSSLASKNTENLSKNSQNNGEIKFITIGDPHIKSGNSINNGGNARLAKIVQLADNSDVDFVVLLGDITNTGSIKDYDEAKRILNNMTKPYYTLPGNHDIKYCVPKSDGTITDECRYNQAVMYEKYFGSQTRLINIKGYQLLFAGIKAEYENRNGKVVEDHFNWVYNFNRTDLDINKPTILFMHGVLKQSPDSCNDWEPGFTRYGESMLPYLEKFNHLIATYSGHVHFDSEQVFDAGKSKGVEFITNDALVDAIGAGGGECSIPAGNYVGYSTINNGVLKYELIPYDTVN